MPRKPKTPPEEPVELPKGPSANGHTNGNGNGRVGTVPAVLQHSPVTRGTPHRSPNDDSTMSIEEYNAIKELLKPGDTPEELDARTEVNHLQMVHYSRARIIAKRFGIRYLDDYVTSLERLSLSLKRKSRKEHVAALQGVQQQDDVKSGILSKLM